MTKRVRSKSASKGPAAQPSRNGKPAAEFLSAPLQPPTASLRPKLIAGKLRPHLQGIIGGCDAILTDPNWAASELARKVGQIRATAESGLNYFDAPSSNGAAEHVTPLTTFSSDFANDMRSLCEQLEQQAAGTTSYSCHVHNLASHIAVACRELQSCVAGDDVTRPDQPCPAISFDDTATIDLIDTQVRWLDQLPEMILQEVNHELRSPLMIIAGNARNLERTELSESQVQHVKAVRRTADRMQRLVNEIRDYQNLARASSQPTLSEFCCREIVAELMQETRARHPSESLTVAVEADATLPPLYSDRDWVARIIGNLLENAFKFTGIGSICCRIGVEAVGEDDWITVEVIDSGRGLSPDEQRELFKPFPKILRREENPDGTGLGLVICRKLCAALGGTIAVDPARTSLGKGAAFVVRLPVRLCKSNRLRAALPPASHGDGAASPAAEVSASKDILSPLAGRGRILIVDDDAEVRALLREMLENLGHVVEEAENGVDAIARLHDRHTPVHLMILDLHMSGLSGLAVLDEVKNDYALRSLPVVVVSGDDSDEAVAHCIARGADDFLNKPCNELLLKARVSSCLLKGQVRRSERMLHDEVIRAKQRADDLLYQVFPYSIAEELRASGQVQPRGFDNVAVMFCDIVSFTSYCEGLAPREVVTKLDQLFRAYEDAARKYRVERIKIIGDCFMATAGLLNRFPNPVLSCLFCADEMRRAAEQTKPSFKVRIGIHAGPVVAGMVGKHFTFDVWGDTVNTAQRVEANAGPHEIFVSEPAWAQVYRDCHGRSAGIRPLKGKASMELFKFEGFREVARVPMVTSDEWVASR